MGSHLPTTTLQLSFPPNCQAPPAGVLVVDDSTHAPVRSGCGQQATQGAFDLQFFTPGASGSYSSKVDLHQQGGGYNAHFYWSHMRASSDAVNNVDDRLKITGRWTLGQPLNQWTRVWVHLPDHAAWTGQAAYEVELGNGQTRTRYLPQRRYANEWVPLGVFLMSGVPAVSLSNVVTVGRGTDTDDVAWDAVGFQPLSSKPADFVVALGDSFSSGEGAGAYVPWSDHEGGDEAIRNACHQSGNAWIRKTTLPGQSQSIGSREAAMSGSLDFHFLACAGAETEHLLPNMTLSANQPVNGEGQQGTGQWGMVSQLDAGYLDENTTLVTLSIGGNDMRFSKIVESCAIPGALMCDDDVVQGDSVGAHEASLQRLSTQLPASLATVLEQIKLRAPNASIALVGYPRLFDLDTRCANINDDNQDWLNEIADGLSAVMNDAATDADSAVQRVIYVDPQPAFQNHTLCSDWDTNSFGQSGINGFVLEFTPGDKPWPGMPVSQQSMHPNDFGTSLYRDALESALQGVYSP